MDIEITIKNYRCFPDTQPAKIRIKDGFTAFVGINNSGKSSLLKFFYEFRNLFEGISEYNSLRFALPENFQQQFSLYHSIADKTEVFNNNTERNIILEIFIFPDESLKPDEKTKVPYKLIIEVSRDERWSANLEINNTPIEFINPPEIQGSVLITGYQSIGELDIIELHNFCRIITNSIYIGPFRNSISVGAGNPYFDIQIGQDFIKTWREYKTGVRKSQNETIFWLTKDIKRIFGFDDLEINPSSDTLTLQIIVNGKSYNLSELGSGLAQFILVLANAAIKQPSLIFIDEPESNLHPTLQLDFLTTLGSYSTNGVIFATHNIGLARSGAERIYSLRKLGEGTSQVTDYESTPRLSEFLGELSFSGYREIGYNKVLLVEGRTDIKTYQQFLRLFKKDHEVVLLPLGGNDLINGDCEAELQELKRISNNIYAIIDSEKESAKSKSPQSRLDFLDICKKVKINCKMLNKRATENYLKEEAVKKIKGPKYRALKLYEKLSDLEFGWAKSENWRIARVMSLADIKGTDLGKFLEKI